MEQSHGISNCLQVGTALKSVSKEAKTFPEIEETFKNEDHMSHWFPCVNETNLNTPEFFGQDKPSSM